MAGARPGAVARPQLSLRDAGVPADVAVRLAAAAPGIPLQVTYWS